MTSPIESLLLMGESGTTSVTTGGDPEKVTPSCPGGKGTLVIVILSYILCSTGGCRFCSLLRRFVFWVAESTNEHQFLVPALAAIPSTILVLVGAVS
jgi:hypothetical protein